MTTWKDEYQYNKYKQYTLDRFKNNSNLVDFYKSLFLFAEVYANNAEDAMRNLNISLGEVNLQHIAINLPVYIKNMSFAQFMMIVEVLLGTYWIYGLELGEMLGVEEEKWNELTTMRIL